MLAPHLARMLTAAVALSMALTPLAMFGYERAASALDAAMPKVEPEETPFDEGPPDIIIAGFGRFGQIVGRLLNANGFQTVVLESNAEQIDLLRRFGRPVHYGDATRIDLLRSAGAETAKVLIIAIDDREKTVELAEKAREAFPHLKILARAWDRRHAYDLLRNGADMVERETFESAISMAQKALKMLGFRSHRAYRAANLFRRHDRRMFAELAPVWGQEENYILASRDAAQTMDRLLQADLQRMRAESDDDAWDIEPLEDEALPSEEAKQVV